jgi:hypothetical protein
MISRYYFLNIDIPLTFGGMVDVVSFSILPKIPKKQKLQLNSFLYQPYICSSIKWEQFMFQPIASCTVLGEHRDSPHR